MGSFLECRKPPNLTGLWNFSVGNVEYGNSEQLSQNVTSDHGRTCFLVAAAGGMTDLVAHLGLVYPKLCKARDLDDETALTLAAKWGFESTVKLLNSRLKLNVIECGFEGRNCFHIAAQFGNDELLTYLGDTYPDLCGIKNYQGHTALTLACCSGKLSTVKLLIERIKCDVRETGPYGRNIFLLAAEAGKTDIQIQCVSECQFPLRICPKCQKEQ